MRFFAFACALPIFGLSALSATILAGEPARPIDFTRDVRPILKSHCFDCHSATKVEADLRLDVASAILEGGNSGPAIVVGKAEESLLFRRVSAINEKERMPPIDSGIALSAEELAVLRAWIEQGAKIPQEAISGLAQRASDHWSFQPIRQPEIPIQRESPRSGSEFRARNPIDAFILKKLHEQGIAPSVEADRMTLIRRLSFDLRGLPPSIEEVDAFLADDHSDAYEQLVDRLLNSPQYGERWARHWLDQARFADSDGYSADSPRPIWPWRDWVIAALNRDQPFNEFVIDQIAGDLRPDPTTDQIVATGFHRNTQQNRENGSDPEQYRVERIADRVSTTGEVLLGLTIGCARCHDHKFDPLSQREFYRLYAFFDGSNELDYRLLSPDQQQEQRNLQTEIAALEKQLRERETPLLPLQLDWERQLIAKEPKWTILDPVEFSSAGGATIREQDDHSLLIGEPPPATDTYSVSADTPLDNVTAVRLEALTDDHLPKRGPGLASNGNFVLNEFIVAVVQPSRGNEPQRQTIASVTADHSQEGFPVVQTIDGDLKTGWAIFVSTGQSSNQDRTATFVLAETIAKAAGRLHITLDQQHGEHLIGRFRLSVTDAPPELLRELSNFDSVRKILNTPVEKRSIEQQQQLKIAYLKTNADGAALMQKIDELRKKEQALLNAAPTTLVIQELPQPRITYVHIRGDFLKHGREVQPGTPSVLPPINSSTERPTRMDLANWLVSPQNPVTPRVMVNRLWQTYFGRGLVETDNDFGAQGTPPTHPQLLDWLASEFVSSDWSLKHMHRLIVTSATYRQSSALRPDLGEVDPRNLLLARQSRHRFDAEVVRDAALAASGLLSLKIGGPSVFPPLADGALELVQSNEHGWTASLGEDRYRRGLYIYFWRSSPHPFLKTFDAPDANVACTRRGRTNTPLQALMLLNDEAFVEAAQGLAARVLADAALSDEARLLYAFRLCASRRPQPKELQRLQGLLEAERAALPDDVVTLTTPAVERFPDHVANKERAAWTSVARALLNLDEFITRE